MRLATIESDGISTASVMRGDDAIPIRRADGAPYRDLSELLGDGGQERVDTALENGRPAAPGWRLMRPVLDPTVWCVGRNYRAHIRETGHEPPPAPVWFGKFSSALTDPEATVALSPLDPCIDYEGELAVVIGQPTRNVDAGAAWDAVAGVTLFNDLSARTLGRERQNVFFGKNLERSSALGPFLLSAEGVADPAALSFEVTVNGEIRQRAELADLVFDLPTLIADISSITTLRPGDVIATGTPGGTAGGFDPPRWLQAGDLLEVRCDPIGVLRSRFE